MKFDFNQNRQQAEKQYNLGKGEYFKVKDGANKVRLISACLPHPGEFNGKPTFKWLCQVIDLTDGKVKPYFMPDIVYQQICSMQLDPDWAFDEVPMPYNINIQTTNAGDKTVKYHVQGSPNRLPLTEEQLKVISEAPSVEELQQKIRDAESKKGIVTKEQAATEIGEEVDVSDIPF